MKTWVYWLAALGLTALATTSQGAAGSALVATDVAWVYSAPYGHEVDRLRRGERVGVLGAVDKRSQREGGVWVRVRRPGPKGHRGWMRARDLAPVASGTAARGEPARENGDWALAAPRRYSGVEVAIVDMDFDCREHATGSHLGSCDLNTVVSLSGDQVLRSALIARLACEVAVDWTGVSGRQYRQSARASRQIPVTPNTPESTLTLSYTFSEAATGALVADQHCFAVGANRPRQAGTIIGRENLE